MFLNSLMRRNPRFIDAAIELHQSGRLPANCYVLDLDTIEANARLFASQAAAYGLTVFAMTKQVGRNSGFCRAIMRGGINRIVAVDMACAIACAGSGMKTGHLGHLVQIPRHEADYAAQKIRPDYWTVFSLEKAQEAAAASRDASREQSILVRIQRDGDIFYRGHEGGFDADAVLGISKAIDSLDGARFSGVTTFPALLFDEESGEVRSTPNLATLAWAREALVRAGRQDIAVNAPGTTSSATIPALADAGATQCEPGNGLHGTTPLHAVKDLPELPAILYLTEISHTHAGRAYCFGGGLYIDPVFADYEVRAIVTDTPTIHAIHPVEIPPASAIDYYGMVDMAGPNTPKPGDSVLFGFRGQAFVTRALVAAVSGIATGHPVVESIEDVMARDADWPTKG